jgi:hypothetical protein
MLGIAIQSVTPMRAAPSEKSEMVSQLLWGETFRVEEQTDGWLHISADLDRYSGWVNPLMVAMVDDEKWEREVGVPYLVASTPLCYAVNEKTKERVLIPQGSLLYRYNEVTQTFMLLNDTYKLEQTPEKLPEGKRNTIVAAARQLTNAPYLWGGRTALGIDCSGLTQLVYRTAGIIIPRDAHQQAEKGETVNFLNSAQPGDLAFFDNEEGKITHVGLLLGENKVLHASGWVHVDSIDSEGIFNKACNRYTHRLRVIKQLV